MSMSKTETIPVPIPMAVRLPRPRQLRHRVTPVFSLPLAFPGVSLLVVLYPERIAISAVGLWLVAATAYREKTAAELETRKPISVCLWADPSQKYSDDSKNSENLSSSFATVKHFSHPRVAMDCIAASLTDHDFYRRSNFDRIFRLRCSAA